MQIEEKIFELKKQNCPFVVSTVVKTSGSTPGKVGFKMIVDVNQKTTGTIGGGAIELEVIKESLKRLSSCENGVEEYLLSSDNLNTETESKLIKMSCNGKMLIYYEVFGELPTVYIFGGGHVGNALLYFLKPLRFFTVLIDNRKEFANEIKNPNASKIINEDYVDFVKRFQPNQNSFFVILTQQHIFDYDVLKTIYERKLNTKYIGVIASKSKASSLKTKLFEEIGKLDISCLHSPIGLNIGGDSAEEIALSIASQIQQVRYSNC
jgi:xanthine dehydrogenase accessory factor